MPAASRRPKALFVLDPASGDNVFGPEQHREIAALADVVAPPQTAAQLARQPELLAEAEVIFTSWGAPQLDEGVLASAPRLRAVFYGAGSVRSLVTPAFWQRDILLTSAAAANALPVAEYTLSVILLSLKKFWQLSAKAKTGVVPESQREVPGAFRSTVGLVSLGLIGRRTAELLVPFDLEVLAYDPFITPAAASSLGVASRPLDELFAGCEVVSLHTPNLPSTRGMITGAHFAAMKPGATFINSARGAVIREPEMIEVLRQRPDLTAVLDVTDPEPPTPDSELRRLPNVILTPHIAGSLGRECRRMGQYMVDEFKRYLAGEPLRYQVTEELAANQA